MAAERKEPTSETLKLLDLLSLPDGKVDKIFNDPSTLRRVDFGIYCPEVRFSMGGKTFYKTDTLYDLLAYKSMVGNKVCDLVRNYSDYNKVVIEDEKQKGEIYWIQQDLPPYDTLEYSESVCFTPLDLAIIVLDILITYEGAPIHGDPPVSHHLYHLHRYIARAIKSIVDIVEVMRKRRIPLDINMHTITSPLIRIIKLRQEYQRQLEQNRYTDQIKARFLPAGLDNFDAAISNMLYRDDNDLTYNPIRIDQYDEQNQTPITVALELGDLRLLRQLLQYTARDPALLRSTLTRRDADALPLLFRLSHARRIRQEDIPMVTEWLTPNPVQPKDLVDPQGKSPLWYALEQGNLPMIHLFIQRGMVPYPVIQTRQEEINAWDEELSPILNAPLKESRSIKNSAMRQRRTVSKNEQRRLNEIKVIINSLESQSKQKRNTLIPLLQEQTQLFIDVFSHPDTWNYVEHIQRKESGAKSLTQHLLENSISQEDYDQIRSWFIELFPEGSGYGGYDGPLLYLHQHTLEMDGEPGGITVEYMEAYLTDQLKETNQSSTVCLIPSCKKELTDKERSALVSLPLWEKYSKARAVPIASKMNDTIAGYDMMLTNRPAPDPAGFGNIHEAGICPFCIQPIHREEGCIYMTHQARRGRNKPYCEKHFIVPEIMEKYKKIVAALEGLAGKEVADKFEFCIECGRPCYSHRHIALDGRSFVTPHRSDIGFDVGKCPGGGLVEKYARVLAIRDIYASRKFRDPKDPSAERRIAADAADRAPLDPEYMSRARAILQAPVGQRKWNRDISQRKEDEKDEKEQPPQRRVNNNGNEKNQAGGRRHRRAKTRRAKIRKSKICRIKTRRGRKGRRM